MATILVAWELGWNYGHVLPLLPVACHLRELGHEVMFAVKALREVAPILTANGFKVVQAPILRGSRVGPPAPPSESMADVLRLHGYDRPETLSTQVRGWRDLMQVTRCDLVVASYAPTALLAARTLQIRTTLVGMPFELPPPVTPSPPFRPWRNVPVEALLNSEAAVVEVVNQAIARHKDALATAYDIFATDRQWLWTFVELDHLASLRRGNAAREVDYLGAIFTSDLGEAPRWPSSQSRRIFGYLRHSAARLAPLVQLLTETESSFSLIVPGLHQRDVDALRTGNVELSSKPVSIRAALVDCDAVLNYAGHGMVCASLLAGRPLVLVAEQVADVLLAGQAERLGAAVRADPNQPLTVADACRQVISEPIYREAAEGFRRGHRDYDVNAQIIRLADELHGLIE